VLTGAGAGRRAPVRGEASIGRSRSCTLRLEDPLASRTHARVRLGPRGAWIEDARSRNGVTLNGVRLDRGPRPLRPGDLIGVGDTTVAYEDPGAAAPASAPRAREEEAPCAAPAPPPPAPLAPGAALPAAPIVAAAALLAACAAALAGAG
jgi:predicted component of type VI protein secretion system